MRLFLLSLVTICMISPAIFAQSPDYLPTDSDHWYQDLYNPEVQIHRYGGSNENHHIESWVNGVLQSHTVWGQSRDYEGNIFNNQASFDGGNTWQSLVPPLPLVQSPLELYSMWDYECTSIPLTYSALVASELYLCAEMPNAFRVVSEQNYNGTVNIFADYYVDGFGVAMMEWYGTVYMTEDCPEPDVSAEKINWGTLKASYR